MLVRTRTDARRPANQASCALTHDERSCPRLLLKVSATCFAFAGFSVCSAHATHNTLLSGRAEWVDVQQSRCLVHWCTPARWAEQIYSWVRLATSCVDAILCAPKSDLLDGPQVKENGMQDGVMTLDELAMGDDTKRAGAADLSAGVM